MSQKVLVRNLEVRDLPGVSAVHMSAFPSSALTQLGLEAVRRNYEWLLLGPHDVVALGAFHQDKAVGFCFGGRFHRALSGFMRKNRAFLTWRLFTHPWLVANPLFRERLTEGVRILKRYAKPKTSVQYPPASIESSFGILAIAVDPQYQGLNVGKVLMKESEDNARRRGYQKMSLTVRPDNHQAVSFYERLNWKKFSRNGMWQGTMRKTLDP